MNRRMIFARTLAALALLTVLHFPNALAQDATAPAPAVQKKIPPKRIARDATIADAKRLANSGELLRLRGTLIYETGTGWFCIADETGSIRGQIDEPIAMKPGDLLEITAKPELVTNKTPWLWHAAAVNLGKGAFPAPVPLALEDAYLDEEHRRKLDATFGMIRATVLGHGTHTGNYGVRGINRKFTFDSIEVDDDGTRVLVIMLEKNLDAPEKYPVGAVIEFTGTCKLEHKIPEVGPGLIQFLVPGPAFIRIVENPPLWQIPRYRRALQIALITLGGAASLGIAWMLGKWRALRRTNATLETRVTERTAELQTALAQQTELAEMKTDFVSLVSHEFRTPLGVIMSAAEVLRRYFDRLTPEKREKHLEMIFRSTRNLAQLIEEVILLGRAEGGRLQFTPVPVEMEKLCRTLADELRSATGDACPIRFQTQGALDGAISDEALLRHIIPNLLSNAVKYSEPGTPVEFTAARDGDDLVLTVRDRGIGIPPEDQAHIFTSFTRGSNVGERPGTGLGLVVVQRCVALHGGDIRIESAPGEGTTVTVKLPVFSNLQSAIRNPQ